MRSSAIAFKGCAPRGLRLLQLWRFLCAFRIRSLRTGSSAQRAVVEQAARALGARRARKARHGMQRARGGRALTPRRAFTAAASRSFSRLLWCTKKFVGARARFPVTAFASAILFGMVSSFPVAARADSLDFVNFSPPLFLAGAAHSRRAGDGVMFGLLTAVQALARADDYGEWSPPGVLE